MRDKHEGTHFQDLISNGSEIQPPALVRPVKLAALSVRAITPAYVARLAEGT